MAKQQVNVSDDILKKFNKAQFKVDEPVHFIWLGMKKYGYVTEIKIKNWGVQYTVAEQTETRVMRYPCGISFKGQKTSYNTGCILFEETRSIGSETIIRRIQTGDFRANTEVFRDTGRAVSKSSIGSDDGGSISTKVDSIDESVKSGSKSTNVVKPSSSRMRKQPAEKRGNIELDTAISKQRDFLNGFVKKD